jgi:tRNA threonylcarbamoyladenosine biosynthesis protein TsaB
VIVAFSTSSPLASVAVFSDDWALLGSRDEQAPRAASSVCLKLLEELLQDLDLSLESATAFGADLGPGSFTGVRVGVTLAKTLAFAQVAQCFGASSFDLISRAETVVLPSKKGEWFVRRVGEPPIKTTDMPSSSFVGFGPSVEGPVYPHASRFEKTELIMPEKLLPAYLTEPAISQPNKPYGLAGPT